MEKTLIFFLVLLLSLSVEMKVEAKKCQLTSVGCSNNDVCNEYCLAKYNGHGQCFIPPGTSIVLCACYYDC
ncbi:hypothetical protein FRX31_002770 [Thalictrum thalictroides]|uniref:Defensin-like protein n=1 Tax=Thalictrum thalictroides TaxID=46969 RepID=A0A7J6XGE0_THATH|nr:hypothetical protein FRX31_002770 [Thalictrum thalictroides]